MAERYAKGELNQIVRWTQPPPGPGGNGGGVVATALVQASAAFPQNFRGDDELTDGHRKNGESLQPLMFCG